MKMKKIGVRSGKKTTTITTMMNELNTRHKYKGNKHGRKKQETQETISGRILSKEHR
jgi:hypothetical protein